MRSGILLALALSWPSADALYAQSSVWTSDTGKGTYVNPVLHADYSDPDAIRVGDDFYMTASSFDAVPGLPILHSKDLVNWELVAHALPRQSPFEHFEKVQHGNGVWAPVIRYHNGEFYIYYPDPDFGIYLTKAKDPRGPWTSPELVIPGKGLIDPCPLWDDDGRAYLVHAYAGSRAGIKSVLVVRDMDSSGTAFSEGRLVYDGHQSDPTIEGPKFYKKDGYYYLFAPAGGVATGWQLVLRSKNVYGPYERKVVMDQGKSSVNGPHQGAWVDTPGGEHWFLHFQDKEAYGRVVHLQPMKWVNGWPVIGVDRDGDGKGEPVLEFRKPDIKSVQRIVSPPESDEFNSITMGLQWQWQANPKATWSFMNTASGTLRLYAQLSPPDAKNLWDIPNVLMQKFPAEEFIVTSRIEYTPTNKVVGEKAGLVIMGMSYAAMELKQTNTGVALCWVRCEQADKGSTEVVQELARYNGGPLYLKVVVKKEGICEFSYSTDNQKYIPVPDKFKAIPGKWIGAKVGLYCTREQSSNDAGFMDVDWFRITRK